MAHRPRIPISPADELAAQQVADADQHWTADQLLLGALGELAWQKHRHRSFAVEQWIASRIAHPWAPDDADLEGDRPLTLDAAAPAAEFARLTNSTTGACYLLDQQGRR